MALFITGVVGASDGVPTSDGDAIVIVVFLFSLGIVVASVNGHGSGSGVGHLKTFYFVLLHFLCAVSSLIYTKDSFFT